MSELLHGLGISEVEFVGRPPQEILVATAEVAMGMTFLLRGCRELWIDFPANILPVAPGASKRNMREGHEERAWEGEAKAEGVGLDGREVQD